MVFLQPVVMNDAHAADRSPAAEVRVVDRRALEQPVWSAEPVWMRPLLAQGGMDQRSPFGNNAPTSNQLTPTPRMVNPTPTDNSGAGQVGDPTTTKIPPVTGQPDAGPPPPSSEGGATPGTEPSATGATAPGTAAGTPAAARTTTMPNTTPSTPTQGTTPGSGAGATPPTIPDTRSVPPQPIEQPSSSTFPGASSGTSNTQ